MTLQRFNNLTEHFLALAVDGELVALESKPIYLASEVEPEIPLPFVVYRVLVTRTATNLFRVEGLAWYDHSDDWTVAAAPNLDPMQDEGTADDLPTILAYFHLKMIRLVEDEIARNQEAADAAGATTDVLTAQFRAMTASNA